MPLPKGVFRVIKPGGKVYWYHQDRRGKPDRGPLTRLPDFGTADFWKEVARLTGKRDEPLHTVSWLIEEYKKMPSWASHAENTRKTYEVALNRIKEGWGSLPVCDITISSILGFLNLYADRPSMGNMILVQVKAMMKLAVQRGIRSDNPAREVDSLDENPDSAKPLTDAAWAALMHEDAPTALKRLAILGRATGQRISDLINLRPCDRDQEGIVCSITKIREKAHWCILTPDEAATIDGWKQFPNLPYVVRENGRRHTDNSLRDVWNDYIKTEAGAGLAGFTPHDLRATKVCDERIRGKAHQRIASIVGMSVEMVMRYSRHIDQRMAARGTKTEREQ